MGAVAWHGRMDKLLRKYLDATLDALRAQIRLSRTSSEHPTIKGSSIEIVLRKVLTKYLPTRYHITSGQIVNSFGGISPQMDVIVCDRTTFPPLVVNEDGSERVCAESVYAAIEVKTTWDEARVAQHFFRCLAVDDERLQTEHQSHDWACYCVIAVESPTAPQLDSFADEKRLVIVCTLEQNKLWRSPPGTAAFDQGKDNPLEGFLFWLLAHCTKANFVDLGSNDLTFEMLRRYYDWPANPSLPEHTRHKLLNVKTGEWS